ncbi:hypothetical protein HETIRDRAFT_424744 [Heterobasidion irregulare TC 32-1]|uniref:UBC core domain-containing protein n=1 Tax=Heterobasidion irregulare (strain TC 32-1) TaxID=747525 RepID=W4KHY6_HETIT|nr:uncharacterized protein HETIRDRAFT_424744 [Heterobasidion irregulare TC 32-1]ETW85473.1 hypothetical protein HETIRDRAFT_424744 [Heterobasidion irregulare TC 32-1]
MAVPRSLNKNNSAVKRIMQEARELAADPSTDYDAAPLEDNIFEWHCTLRGPPGTDFAGGLYHARVMLPAEYPFRPPSIMLLTPNGRFELNTKICISFTNYHEELWQPAWGVRTAIIGLQGFFPLKGQAAAGVGALEVPAAERRHLATMSREWVCPHCNRTNLEMLPDPPAEPDADSTPIPAPDPSAAAPATASAASAENADQDASARASAAPAGPDPEAGAAREARTEPGAGAAETETETETRTETEMTKTEGAATGRATGAEAGMEAATRSEQAPAGASAGAETAPGAALQAEARPVRVTAHALPSAASSASSASLSASATPERTLTPLASRTHTSAPRRPPLLLDTAICVLLVLMFALICRRPERARSAVAVGRAGRGSLFGLRAARAQDEAELLVVGDLPYRLERGGPVAALSK